MDILEILARLPRALEVAGHEVDARWKLTHSIALPIAVWTSTLILPAHRLMYSVVENQCRPHRVTAAQPPLLHLGLEVLPALPPTVRCSSSARVSRLQKGDGIDPPFIRLCTGRFALYSMETGYGAKVSTY